MDAQLPSYLKSLEAIIASGNTTAVAPAGAPAVPVPVPVSVSATPTPTFQTMTMPTTASASASSAISSSKKVRFLMVSTHAHQFTGYSKVSYHTMQTLSKLPWLDVTHYGFQKMPQVPPNYRNYPSNIDVIDAAATEKKEPGQQGFGFAALPDVIRRKQPHVVLIYNDMAVVTKFLEEIRKSGIPRTFKIWVYVDQVYTTQFQAYLDVLNRDADLVFTFSPFWKKCLKDQGITRPMDVFLHGFDPTQYFPVPKELVRKQLGIPNDAFLILNLNRNQPRKRYDLLIMAFVELIVKYPTKPILLMCICDKGDKGGWWLFEIFQRELKLRNVPIEQFGNRLMVAAQDMVYKDDDVNMFYNLADIGISTAEGEGWGLCQFEQMGVGIPQVVPDIGGFKEFCSSENTILVKPKHRYYLPTVYSPVGGEAMACDPHDICLAVEEYLMDSDKRVNHGKKARETVMGYTWEKATSRLVKRLEEEKKELDEE
jgi:glycosyltransferase involved in cell wall biosynthesis